MEKPMNPKSGETHVRLQAARDALLNLHKTLVDSEREIYEKTFGSIQSPNQFLKLLMDDPWFAWLHPMSQLIVTMDEALDEKEPLTEDAVKNLQKQAGELLIASEIGEGFSHHYFDALQLTGYYYTFIGIAQIITAILLLIPRTSLLGALMYFPIIVNICVLTYATRFDGTRGVTMMLLASLFLLIWDYDRLKHILPFR